MPSLRWAKLHGREKGRVAPEKESRGVGKERSERERQREGEKKRPTDKSIIRKARIEKGDGAAFRLVREEQEKYLSEKN
jgi:hypothetical protein